MSKNKSLITPTAVYTEFKELMYALATTASELQPFDFDNLRQQVLAYHEETGAFSHAFYSVIDMQTGDFSWQHGIGASLGMPVENLSIKAFLSRLHPDYLPMFRFWAIAINEAAYSMELGERMRDYVYHISLPLRREDASYHWYIQHSFALQSDNAGHYVNHFNFYDYNGPWHAHNRSPFLPYVTKQNQPAIDLEKRMLAIAVPRLKALFTATEQALIEWYMNGEPSVDKLRMQPHTLHEHNSHILKKATAILLTDFKSAREAAILLMEANLWCLAG